MASTIRARDCRNREYASEQPQSFRNGELGLQLTGVPVGSSADVAFAAETGTPSIDGIAIRGGGAHGVDDYADLSSVVPRVYLLSRMLMDLGRNPPLRDR